MSRMRTLAGLAWREGRGARRRLLLYMSSISLGVAALVAIDSFGKNVTESVREQSRELLGGDMKIETRERIPARVDSLIDSLRGAGHRIARITTLNSMASAVGTGRTRLVQVRGVSTTWPLVGRVETAPAGGLPDLHRERVAIVDRSVLASLGVGIGDSLAIGVARFRIAAAIERIPGDVGVAAVVAPRVLIGAEFLEDTKLLAFGSRTEREVILQAEPSFGATRLAARLRGLLAKTNLRVRTATQMQDNLTDFYDRLAEFLSVVGLVALLLGGVGVASGVHAFVARKIDVAAVLRCLGATSRQVLVIYSVQAAAMGLVGALAGTLLGVAVQLLLPHVAGTLLPVQVVVRIEPRAVGLGLGIGVWVALAFALWPLIALRRVSPLQTLRREADAEALQLGRFDPARVVVAVALVASVGAIVLARVDEPRLGVGYAVAIAVAVFVLTSMAWLLSRGARALLRARWPFVFRHGVSSLYRPGNQTRAVMLALGFGVFLVSTLYQAGSMLVRRFTIAADAATANVLFFDVQPDQRPGVDSVVTTGGWKVMQQVPIVTMRIAALNGVAVDSLLKLPKYTRTPTWAWRREYRSTFRDSVVASEKLTAGTWFRAAADPVDTIPEVSFDGEIARDMGLALGDVITWEIQGVRVTSRVTSLREVNWAQFTPNFFAVFEPAALAGAPAQWVLLASVPADTAVARIQRDVVAAWPNVSSIDLSLVQRTIEGIVRQMSTAVRFLALFSVAMGLPVLFSAVAATRRARMRESVLLKTLGATRAQVRAILVTEYLALGALGALTGLILSIAGSWALAKWVLDVPFAVAVFPALGILAGMLLLSLAVGTLSGREVFSGTPMAALRE